MKINNTFKSFLLIIVLSFCGFAGATTNNIIRVNAPVVGKVAGGGSGSGQLEESDWVITTPIYSEWSDSVLSNCTWLPKDDANAKPGRSTIVPQTAVDCVSERSRTVQSRELNVESGAYRNVGDLAIETISIPNQASSRSVRIRFVLDSINSEPFNCSWSNESSPDLYPLGIPYTVNGSGCLADSNVTVSREYSYAAGSYSPIENTISRYQAFPVSHSKQLVGTGTPIEFTAMFVGDLYTGGLARLIVTENSGRSITYSVENNQPGFTYSNTMVNIAGGTALDFALRDYTFGETSYTVKATTIGGLNSEVVVSANILSYAPEWDFLGNERVSIGSKFEFSSLRKIPSATKITLWHNDDSEKELEADENGKYSFIADRYGNDYAVCATTFLADSSMKRICVTHSVFAQ